MTLQNKKIIIFFCLFIVSLFITSCSTDKTQDMEVYNLQPIFVDADTTHLTDKYDIEIVKLDNNINCQISIIDKLIVNSKGILVYDHSSTPKVFCFDKNGKYMAKIDKFGHAKDEYDHVLDVCSNDAGDSIILLQYNRLKIYDDKGNFISSKNIDEQYHWEKLERNDKYGYVGASEYTNAEYLISVCDNSFKVNHEFVPTKGISVKRGSYVWNPIWCSHGKIVFCDYYFSSIYVEDIATHQKKCYKINTGNTAIEKEAKTEQGQYDHFIDIAYDGVYVFGHMLYNKKYKVFKLCPNTNQFFMFKSVKDWCPNVIAYHDGCFYEALSPEHLIQIKNYPKYPKWLYKETYDAIMAAMKPYIDDLDENDNYYLLKYIRKN